MNPFWTIYILSADNTPTRISIRYGEDSITFTISINILCYLAVQLRNALGLVGVVSWIVVLLNKNVITALQSNIILFLFSRGTALSSACCQDLRWR